MLDRLRAEDNTVELEDVLTVIDEYYEYAPVAFDNGTVHNEAGQNAGSCKLLAWALLHGLAKEEVLLAFGRHYRDLDPAGRWEPRPLPLPPPPPPPPSAAAAPAATATLCRRRSAATATICRRRPPLTLGLVAQLAPELAGHRGRWAGWGRLRRVAADPEGVKVVHWRGSVGSWGL